MSHVLVRRPKAEDDLIEIWTYIAQEDEAAADRVLEKIEKTLSMISRHPTAGRSRPELFADLRSFPVGPYILFYVVTDSGIELIRVLSGYRDIDESHLA